MFKSKIKNFNSVYLNRSITMYSETPKEGIITILKKKFKKLIKGDRFK